MLQSKKKKKREICISLIKLKPEPKRTHKPAVQVLLIKMGSVLSSIFFRFPSQPRMYGPHLGPLFPGSRTPAMCCYLSQTYGLMSADGKQT